MAEYFTSDHFKLLNKWRKQKRDDSNPEQNRAYKELQEAYEITELWADQVQKSLFPNGYVNIRKRPTSQGNTFFEYTWAKIYPTKDAPKELAYTVGISADEGFIVKIDTVGIDDFSPTRKEFLKLRSDSNNTSPILAILPTEEGLSLSLPGLTKWSVEAIRNFSLKYDDIVDKLGLMNSTKKILSHFQKNKDFAQRQPNWSDLKTQLFIRLANRVHDLGLDWYFTEATNSQLRFGRKEKNVQRGNPIGWLFLQSNGIRVTLDALGNYPGQASIEINENVIDEFEKADLIGAGWPQNLKLVTERDGYWPDEYIEEYEIESSSPISKNDLSPKNVIYYGPPGTGKTYTLQKLLKSNYTQQPELTSPEEWKAEKIANEIGNLTWWEAIAAALYDLGGKAKVGQLLDHAFIKSVATAKNRKNMTPQTIWGTLQTHANEESTTVKTEKRAAPYIFEKTNSSEWFLYKDWKDECKHLIAIVDAIKLGTDTFANPIERYSFVTFHQSYGYEEFVEGLRPRLEDDSDDIGYEIKKGAFFQLCKRARLDPNHQYAIVIDEINRGNISKIFGELITLIEIDKRDPLNGSKPPIEIKLAYSGDLFSVPANVDIIGTMNTADRSLALVDTALRRRFDFLSCMPDTRDVSDAPLAGLVVTMDGTSIDVRKMLEKMNQRIEALYDRDHTIGHAYFTQLHNTADGPSRFEELSRIFRNRIIPLLEEYFFEDWQKIRLVLADNQKPEIAQFVRSFDDQDNDLTNLFGDDNELDQYSTQKRFFIAEEAFLLPHSFVGVYESVKV